MHTARAGRHYFRVSSCTSLQLQSPNRVMSIGRVPAVTPSGIAQRRGGVCHSALAGSFLSAICSARMS